MESPIIPAEMSRYISPSLFASYSSKPIVPGVEYESILQEVSLDSGGFMTLSDWRCHANTEHHISLMPDIGTEVHSELDPMNPVIAQANKRRRGRPRLIPQHSRAERRRAQIREAQRTYRERKDKTIADLKARISKLQSTVDSMRASDLPRNI
ncbi:hypothetical protein V1508DRAFT_428479 [Lipomyces doorenjongii]|uniref:uncharacterized protein n=1 Tax=Lipomyces doorenjongii TaxID=383834 RepID=UPI0034CE0262